MTNEEAVNVLRIMASGIELKGYTEIWVSSFKEAYEMAIKALEERPQGEWIKAYVDKREFWFCKKCEYPLFNEPKTNFCPNCGADMRGAV